jgi:3-vinyl bacteriochlorophyllide hydratase
MFALGQLGIFMMSVVLLALYFLHVVPFAAVQLSILIKIVFMIGAVLTGSFWEHDVYGKWWFAHEFFIEDVMTLNVFALHVLYLVTYYVWPWDSRAIIAVLLVAYAVYGLNVLQYIISHVNANKGDEGGSNGPAVVAA